MKERCKKMKIIITDYTDYVPGLENNGGCYIYYTTIERVGGQWFRTDSSSCEFELAYGPFEIGGAEVKRLIESAKNDSNCRVKFLR